MDEKNLLIKKCDECSELLTKIFVMKNAEKKSAFILKISDFVANNYEILKDEIQYINLVTKFTILMEGEYN